jgi:diguanylate cyclase (GGDEF)-like protein
MSFHWSTRQLTEYLAAVSAPRDEDGAALTAVERAAEALDAEVGVAVINGNLRGSFGFAGADPSPELALATAETTTVQIPSLGTMHATAGVLGRGADGALVIARFDGPFDAEERQMLRGMAQVLGLVLRSQRAMNELHTRQRLLETLLNIQREVSNRKPLDEVLDAVTSGASSLLGGAGVALVLIDPIDVDRPILASTHGHKDHGTGHTLVLAAAVNAMDTDEVVIHRDPASETLVVAAPVYVDNAIAGSLVVDTAPGSLADRRELLGAFAQQVSMALTDASTVDAVRQAYHDPLTGMPNRRLFLDRLQDALSHSRRHDEQVTVLFIDLDRFKTVNDCHGHQVGDALLTAVADRLQGCLRPADAAARLGGDEFAVVLENTTAAEGVLIAERIVTSLTMPFLVAGHDASISASIGVALSPRAHTNGEELLSNADVAMYRAKKDGGGRVIEFEPRMHQQVRERLSLQSDLRQALGLGRLWLQYQPLIRLDDGAPVAVEALLRWSDPQRGQIPPSVFIPIAEESGLIFDLGRWVLAVGVEQIMEWRELHPDLTLNVNTSARQVVDPRFVSEVAELLRASGLPAAALTLELTETVLVRDPVAARQHLSELKELGVKISIDDFGTGYSSLTYLRQFPVDEIKIDRTFTMGICRTPEDLAVVRAVIDLARALHLNCVAEGIEDADQLEQLRALGCALGQGYHLSRPLSPGAARDYLASHAGLTPVA